MGSNDFDAGGWGMTVTQISRQEEKEIFQHGEAPGLTVARLGEVGGSKWPDRPLQQLYLSRCFLRNFLILIAGWT